ncbi:hypothetical protein ACCO45_001905 [Purpureocillium lilacinum]|uniref:Uncharacterized protein n=1 Tax=Purpureocillium lilacinum TaxID=33203 RepID=A0ACC4EB15_PURLI
MTASLLTEGTVNPSIRYCAGSISARSICGPLPSASWPLVAAVQACDSVSPCQKSADAVPNCAKSCIQSAAVTAAKCQTSDYACQCSKSADIQAAALACVTDGCGLNTALQVVTSVQAMCSCVTASPTTPCGSTDATTTAAGSSSTGGSATTTGASSTGGSGTGTATGSASPSSSAKSSGSGSTGSATGSATSSAGATTTGVKTGTTSAPCTTSGTKVSSSAGGTGNISSGVKTSSAAAGNGGNGGAGGGSASPTKSSVVVTASAGRSELSVVAAVFASFWAVARKVHRSKPPAHVPVCPRYTERGIIAPASQTTAAKRRPAARKAMASQAGDDSPEATIRRTAHVQALLERLLQASPIYGLILPTIRLESASHGLAVTTLTLTPTHVNSKGGLHGAVSATIIDFTTGLAIASTDLREATGASVDMHISYLSIARVGDKVRIETRAEKVGGSLAFVTVKIVKVAEDGSEVIVTMGQHTKYVRGTAPPPIPTPPTPMVGN